jgi:hypothetical protein
MLAISGDELDIPLINQAIEELGLRDSWSQATRS